MEFTFSLVNKELPKLVFQLGSFFFEITGLIFASSLLIIGFLDVGSPLDRISSYRKNRDVFVALKEQPS